MTTVSDATRISSSNDESSSPFIAVHPNRNNKCLRGRGRGRNNGAETNDSGRKNRTPKIERDRENLSASEKFELCVLFQASNMFTRQISGNIVNRLKGNITDEEFKSNEETLRARKEVFGENLKEIVASFPENGLLTDDIIARVSTLLASIPLKEKNQNQKAKLTNKMLMSFQKQGLYSADPHKELKQKIMELSPDERTKVLMALPLR
jgi:hypothetical protein